MVKFPGPFSKKAKQKKRARSKEQESTSTPRSGYSSAEEAADFYSDLEEASVHRPAASRGASPFGI